MGGIWQAYRSSRVSISPRCSSGGTTVKSWRDDQTVALYHLPDTVLDENVQTVGVYIRTPGCLYIYGRIMIDARCVRHEQVLPNHC